MLSVTSVSFGKSRCDLVTAGGGSQKASDAHHDAHHVFCKHVLY